MKLIEAFLDIHLGINMRSFTHELFGEPPFSPGALGLSLSPPHTVRDRSAQLLMLGSGEAIDNFVVAQMTRGVAPPRFFLSNRARAVLRFAIDGLLDAEIAHEVGISSNGLKKRWQQIFEQIRATDPDFFGNESSVGSDDGKRGAERRHSVLAYVRSHREELHPYATAPVGVS
jgi:DNA-binding NarL/FixJ family response regulator